MKVTPLDLRQQRFKTVMRGYDRGEVQAFLLEVSDDYENALRENDKLRQDVARLDAMLAEHRGQERNLRNTLLTAQKHADDVKEHAQTEAGLIIRDAEGQRDLILQKAQARLEEGASPELLHQVAAAPVLANQQVRSVQDHDGASAERRRIGVNRGHAEQRVAHAKHRDALAASQLAFRVFTFDVVELAGEQPDVVPVAGLELRWLRDTGNDARRAEVHATGSFDADMKAVSRRCE